MWTTPAARPSLKAPSFLELGTWNLELGTWNLELGTWNFTADVLFLYPYEFVCLGVLFFGSLGAELMTCSST